MPNSFDCSLREIHLQSNLFTSHIPATLCNCSNQVSIATLAFLRDLIMGQNPLEASIGCYLYLDKHEDLLSIACYL
ncbi:hypothetical protein MA16_Dca016741 [Dendrobium catenatum]|uniref:Uncharacterized protein n=1 Tax=Dendrobium catenatum TaxID=906689 RepID=A0A2I0VJL1_9ASPA|nr:hypothetical protein MA16_Dca016741 [Dendrobium catenatum]